MAHGISIQPLKTGSAGAPTRADPREGSGHQAGPLGPCHRFDVGYLTKERGSRFASFFAGKWLSHCLVVLVLVALSSPTLRDPMDCSSPGSSMRGILQAGMQEWVAISLTRDLANSETEPCSPALQEDSLPFKLQQMQQGSPFPSCPGIHFLVMFSFACIVQLAGS